MARGSRRPAAEQPVDHPRAADREVVALPARPGRAAAALLPHGGRERRLPGLVVRAVGMPAEVAEPAVPVVGDQVPGQGAHRAVVVAAYVGGGLRRGTGQGHRRNLRRQAAQLARRQRPVVQDEPVALPGQRQDPAARIVPVHVHRPDQQVEAAVLGGDLDPAVDHVDELQAFRFLGERALARLGPGNPPEHDPDDFLEPCAERPGRPVRDEAELIHRLEHPLPRLRARVPVAAVQHPGDRRDGYARCSRHVVDGGRRAGGLGHGHQPAFQALPAGLQADQRVDRPGGRPARLIPPWRAVSAYQGDARRVFRRGAGDKKRAHTVT